MNRQPLFASVAGIKSFDTMNIIRKELIIILIAGFTWLVNADPPQHFMFNVVPKSDTMTAGDSIPVFGIVIDDTGGIHHEFDTCIHWTIIPANTRNKLSATAGSQATYYALEAYRLNYIIASFTPPMLPNRILFDTVTIYIKCLPMNFHLYVEPDTNINPNDHSAASIARLTSPDKVPLVTIPQNDTVGSCVAAILRDKFGNFVRFSRNGIWKVIGDTGIVGISTPDKPYVCAIAGLKPGTTSIRLSDDSGSVPDTVMVDNRHFKTSVRPMVGPNRLTLKAFHEYYNLRGQRLSNYGIRHTDGIILERIIAPTGKVTVRKKIVPVE